MNALNLITLIILYIPIAFTTLRAIKDVSLIYKIIYIIISAFGVYASNYFFIATNIAVLFIFYKKGIIISENCKLTKKINISEAAVLTAVVLGIKIIFALINIGYFYLLKKFNIPIESQEIIKQLNQSSAGWFLYLSAIIIFLAPVAEEFCFRYFIYDFLLCGYLRINKYISAAISAIVFSALHANIAGALTFFMLGLMLNYIYEKKGLFASALVHAEYNAFSVISILFIQKLGGL